MGPERRHETGDSEVSRKNSISVSAEY